MTGAIEPRAWPQNARGGIRFGRNRPGSLKNVLLIRRRISSTWRIPAGRVRRAYGATANGKMPLMDGSSTCIAADIRGPSQRGLGGCAARTTRPGLWGRSTRRIADAMTRYALMHVSTGDIKRTASLAGRCKGLALGTWVAASDWPRSRCSSIRVSAKGKAGYPYRLATRKQGGLSGHGGTPVSWCTETWGDIDWMSPPERSRTGPLSLRFSAALGGQ